MNPHLATAIRQLIRAEVEHRLSQDIDRYPRQADCDRTGRVAEAAFDILLNTQTLDGDVLAVYSREED